MSSDRSRISAQPRLLYHGIVAQQGRVLLDRDINDLQDISNAERAEALCDIIGPCGTPDDGFRIGPPQLLLIGGEEQFYSPPAEPLSPPSTRQEFERDFIIHPGTMYLGGQRVEFAPTQNGHPVLYTYFDQPNWLAPPRIDLDAERELVYLVVDLQEVSAVEDPDLLEIALGGPDTTQRLRLLARVARFKVTAGGCVAAWDQFVKDSEAKGYAFNPHDMRFTPAVRLEVGFTDPASAGNPCDPAATGGYLGADNQLIRVQTATIGGEKSLVWGYDNASFLYRISGVNADGVTLTLASNPPDAFHAPQTGQLVEILQTAAVIASIPDETDPTGKAQILRVNAEPSGSFFTLSQPYAPPPEGNGGGTVKLSSALDPGLVAGQQSAGAPPLFLRIWQAKHALSLNQAIPLQDPSTGYATGLTVTFSGAAVAADGAYWQIAARPSLPQGAFPEDLLTSPQPPDGPLLYACPLAVIDWAARNGPVIHDCRNRFDNLVELSRRKPGCCTVAISPSDITAAASLQDLIDKAAASADVVTVCLGAGDYKLAAPLYLTGAHSRLTLESCGGTAIFSLGADADDSLFVDGLINIAGSTGITLQGLTLKTPLVLATKAILERLIERLGSTTDQEQALTLLRTPYLGFGIRAYQNLGLTLFDCNFEMTDTRPDTSSDLIAAAVFLQGEADDLTIRNCHFKSRIPLTFTPQQAKQSTRESFTPNIAAARTTQASPPASPPDDAATPNFDIEDEAATGSALSAVLQNRVSEDFATRQRPLNATAAILLTGYSGPQAAAPTGDGGGKVTEEIRLIDAPASLGAATIEANTLLNFSFASLMLTELSLLRLADNNVSGGLAGFWLARRHPVSPKEREVFAGTYKYYPKINQFEEWSMLFAFAAVLAPALPPTAAGGARNAEPQAGVNPAPSGTASGLNATLMVSGNHISTGLHPPPTLEIDRLNPQVTAGLCALLLWLLSTDSLEILDNSDISVLLTGNHCINGYADSPTALLLLPGLQPCAISGNILLNQPGRIPLDSSSNDGAPPSLWLVYPGLYDSDRDRVPLAVTGNVLRGASDLASFRRDAAATRTGWPGYNADPY